MKAEHYLAGARFFVVFINFMLFNKNGECRKSAEE